VVQHASFAVPVQEGRRWRACAVYLCILLEALRDEAVVPVEYAPVFERAVESLLFDAANMPGEKA